LVGSGFVQLAAGQRKKVRAIWFDRGPHRREQSAGMFTWYRVLSSVERRTFWACFSGWSMDAMDAQVFSFIIPTLMATWSINSTEAGYLGTAALVATAIGGWISGFLADRFGRVRVLQFTVAWFAFFTFLAGFAQSYDQMLAIRVFQGFGFGGEWGAGAVLMGEIIRPEHRGKAVGCVQSGYGIGWMLATALYTLIFLWLPPSFAWRALLWMGLIPAALVIYIRRFIDEPPVYREAKALEHGASPGLLAIFRPALLRTTLLSSLLALGVIGVGTAAAVWLPSFLKTARHFSVSSVGTYMTVVTFGSFLGFIGSAYLTDFVGRRWNFIIFLVTAWIITVCYMYLPLNDTELLILSFPYGFFVVGCYGSLGPFFTELFPTAIRATGQSFAYNFGKGVGAFSVVGVGWLAQRLTLGEAIGALSLGGYLIAILAVVLLPETRGLKLSPSESAPLVPAGAPAFSTGGGHFGRSYDRRAQHIQGKT
jgi:MFS family permease